MSALINKKIVLGITGGIAAYKTVDLASKLKKQGADVYAVCTDNALEFVSALSLQVMTQNRVFNKQYISSVENADAFAYDKASASSDIKHISLADEADLILIAPCTANTISKLASGLSDNLLLDICLATKAPVMVAPAMNTNMWQHPIIKKNISILKEELSYEFIEPGFGELACGHVGEGRLEDVDLITQQVSLFFKEKALLN